jgi:hypothetical protein
MGSTGSYVPEGKTPKQVVLDYQNQTNAEGKEWKLLKHTSKRGDGFNWDYVIYGAYQTPYGLQGVTIMYKFYPKNREVVHKEVLETSGPVYTECPNNILDMLSETTNEYALKWRMKCREHNAGVTSRKKLEDGDKVRFTNGFGHFTADQIFTVMKRGRKTRFWATGRLCNLQGWTRCDYEIVIGN